MLKAKIDALKNIHFVVSIACSLVLGTIWVESRYYQTSNALCEVEKSAISREVDINELKLEFYMDELERLTRPPAASSQRIHYLNTRTLSLETRNKVLKLDKEKLSC